jgi:hypothetical protein
MAVPVQDAIRAFARRRGITIRQATEFLVKIGLEVAK